MGKILLLLLAFSLVFIGGCADTSEIQEGDIVYQAIQQSFLRSPVFSDFTQNAGSATGIIRESLGLYSQYDGTAVFSDIIMGITVDSTGSNSVTALQFSGVIEDKEYDDTFFGSGIVYQIQSGAHNYLNWKSGYISLGEGNAESFIITMILDSIKDQRILLDDNALIATDGFAIVARDKLFSFVTMMRESFYQSGFMLVDTQHVNGIYPSTLGNDGMNLIVGAAYDLFSVDRTENIELSFQGHIQTSPIPQLIIEDLQDIHNNRHIQGYIGIRNGALTFAQDTVLYTISWEERRNRLILDIAQSIEEKEIFHLSTTLAIQNMDNNTVNAISYEGEVSFSVGDSTRTNILFPIAGVYSIAIVDELLLTEPNSYILMSQLFGDEYGILRLLESE